MKVCYTPHKSVRNQYINLFTQSLSDNGVEIYGLKEVLTNFKKYKETKVFHFNWFLKVNSKNKTINILEYIIKFFILFLLKITGKKIVYTLHNKLPHDLSNRFIASRLNKFLLKCSDNIIVHCYEDSKNVLTEYLNEEEIKRKIRYIVHGNYIGVYPENLNKKTKEILKNNENEKVFLFLGSVEPYKNTHLLIEAFKDLNLENTKLIVAGNPKSKEYKDKIEKISQGANIVLELRFLEDDELAGFIKNSDILILPYNNDSSLNSGSVFLAFSYGKTVLSSKIGTLNDIDKDFYYSYEYKDEKDHIEKLKNNMSVIKKEVEADPEILTKKGQEAYEHVLKNNDWMNIGKKVLEIYSELGVENK